MSNKLVAYFSTGGVTARLAKTLADAIGADLYEIKPARPYNTPDLDWSNPKSRTSIECGDKAFRPEMAGAAPDTARYDTVYIGFPIWWYTAPPIVKTFLESCDLKGKTVAPFATSGSSGMGDTARDLAPSCPGAVIAEGQRFPARAAADSLSAWAGKAGM